MDALQFRKALCRCGKLAPRQHWTTAWFESRLAHHQQHKRPRPHGQPRLVSAHAKKNVTPPERLIVPQAPVPAQQVLHCVQMLATVLRIYR